eukprot:m.123753 g.123753  ORF g.123753 m.123753 type:complete len:73 (+) comp13757_c0_seq3:27-245(+)
MSAIFNFTSLLEVLLLLICACAYFRSYYPQILDRRRHGALSLLWKFARIGERASPYVALGCVTMAIHMLAFQ